MPVLMDEFKKSVEPSQTLIPGNKGDTMLGRLKRFEIRDQKGFQYGNA